MVKYIYLTIIPENTLKQIYYIFKNNNFRFEMCFPKMDFRWNYEIVQ